MPIMSSHAGSIASVSSIYTATVDGFAGLIAHWTCSSATQLTNRKADERHGTYSAAVALVGGLPQNSDQAIDFGGTASASIDHDAGLLLSEFSLSVWFKLKALPGEGVIYSLFSKDQPGLNLGDFQLIVDEDSVLRIQFQDLSTQHKIFATVTSGVTYHLAVRADGTGFDAYLNGAYLGKNSSFTDAWASNSNGILLAGSQTHAALADAIIDQVALFPRVLSENEVLSLAQATSAPVAVNDNFVVPESATTALNVTNNDTFVGQKSALTVELWNGSIWTNTITTSHGTATVRGDKDIDFAASAVSADEADSFTYRITDQNGASNVATANLTVQDVGSVGGGTLVYEFVPQASWIDGVSLSNRDSNDVIGPNGGQPTTNRWTASTGSGGGVTVGSGLVRATRSKGGTACWNRAPDGSPSLEMYAATGVHNVCDFAVELYEPLAGGSNPRHLRTVMEVRTCKSSDPTTHKANGLGSTTGSYPDFSNSHSTPTASAVKYFCCLYQGTEVGGPVNVNWWGDSTKDLHHVGHMSQMSSGSKTIESYIANFDRPGAGGGSNPESLPNPLLATANDVEGHWVRHEIEVYLGDPAKVPDNARRAEPEIEPSHTGDGFCRLYATPDIDGDLGTPGTRKLIAEVTGLIFNPKFDDVGAFDNMHTLNNLVGPWIDYHYGGSTVSNSPAWAWLRKLQVYRHD